MDQRFVRVWDDLRRRTAEGERVQDVLRRTETADLVAALAAAGGRDDVLANVIATELLNRERRAPFFGAFLVSATFAVAMFLLDWLFTGTPFPRTPGRVSTLLFPVLLLTMVGSLMMYRMSRGGFPRLRMALQRWRSL